MKILSRGIKKPKYPWMKHPWICWDCKTLAAFEEDDLIEFSLRYTDDQRDGEFLKAQCPVCERETTWYPERKET